jgi:hypothetical protein
MLAPRGYASRIIFHRFAYTYITEIISGVLFVLIYAASSFCQANTPDSGPSKSPSDSVTFVHFTDAHLFDDGKRATTAAEGLDQQRDNWHALRWAIKTTNDLIESGRPIDFVIFTGDLGLELVRSKDDETCGEKDKNDLQKLRTQGWPELFDPPQAAAKLAQQLSMLRVKTIYVIPGNNDLACESPKYLDKYAEFIKQTAALLPVGSPHLVNISDPQASVQYGIFRILALNSASFKTPDNYSSFCMPAKPGCPEFEMRKIEGAVRTNPEALFLIFTHIPDLLDPGVPNDPNSPDCDLSVPQTGVDAWKGLSPSVRHTWSEVGQDPRVIGIFAGHFHSCNPFFYSTRPDTNALVNNENRGFEISKKTWISPPLALKFQEQKTSRARGLLLVHIQRRAGESRVSQQSVAISVVPFWYSDPTERASWIPHAVNFFFATGLVFAAFWALSKQPKDTFVRLAFWLFAIWTFGHMLVDSVLGIRLYRGLQTSSFEWDWYLVLCGDLFAIAFIWMWLTIFRGQQIENYSGTIAEMLGACAIVIPADLFISYQYQEWKLLPSAVLNILILGAALVACLRYKRRGIPLAVTMGAYSLAKVPAYEYAASGIAGPEVWLYYSLGLCEIIIFWLTYDLLFHGEMRRDTPIDLFSADRVVALVALLLVVVEKWELIKKTPMLLTITIFVPALAVSLAYRDLLTKKNAKAQAASNQL